MIKLETEINSNMKQMLESNALRALHDVIKSRDYYMQIPIHTSNMNIEQLHTGTGRICKTIIPPLNIFLDQQGLIGDKIANRYLGYRISYNNNPIPLSHVYNSSGYLCLGNIFVPELIPAYAPQLPLETLFLANDRNMAHGDPVLSPSKEKRLQINDILHAVNDYSGDLDKYISNDTNWCEHDILWQIGNELLTLLDHDSALIVADKIFKIIFSKKG